MDVIDKFIEGAISGLGMWIMMTVLGILSFFALKKFFTKFVAKLWADIKKEGLKFEGEIQLKRKK